MKFLVEPWAHQLEAIELAKKTPNFALFMEMGTGKTSTMINILRWRFMQTSRVMRTLILCPPIVVQNWRNEFEVYSKIPRSKITPLIGAQTVRIRDFTEKAAGDTIVITNYEALLMEELYSEIVKWRPEILILDESHRCKEITAKRTKKAVALADTVRHKYLLTGTPVLNTPMDLFAQYRILDHGKTFGNNFYLFRANFFYDKNYGMPKDKHFPCWIPRPDTLEIINRKLKETSYVAKKADCLTLPPLVKKTVYVELSAAQEKAYKEMKRDFITFVKGEAAVATIALTKGLKLMQIVSGFVSVERKNTATGQRTVANLKLAENPRAKALKELLADLTPISKVLVWAVFKENYDTVREICNDLGIDYVEIHGEISPKAKDEAVTRLNNDPTCRVLIGHPRSGGIGVNLVGASYSIFYSRTFSLEEYLQAEARNHRGGSQIHEKITHIDIVAKGTIDELVTKKLAEKIQIADKILLDIAGQL